MKLALLAAMLLANSVVYTGPDPALIVVRAARCSRGAKVACARFRVVGPGARPEGGWVAVTVYKARLDQEQRLIRSDEPDWSGRIHTGDEQTVDMADGSPRFLWVICDLCAPAKVLIEPGNQTIEVVLEREKPPPGFAQTFGDGD